MRTVVTGSEGFIARHLPLADEVLQIDLETGDDIRLLGTMDVIRDFEPEVVFHLAAHHFIPWCEQNPIETDRTNVLGTANVLEAANTRWLKAFVFASSAAVYGYAKDPIPETAPLAGRNVYANSKYRGEVSMRSFARDDVAFVAARLFNVVGPGDKWEHVLPRIIQGRYEHMDLGNTWPRRDYVHVQDAAEALQFLATHAPYGFSAYNVGTGFGTSVADLLAIVGDVIGHRIAATTSPGKVRSEDGHLVSDPSKLSSLGWTSRRTVRDAVIDILNAEEISPAP